MASAAEALSQTASERAPAPRVCADPRCVALPLPGGRWCVTHSQLTRREKGSAPINCYACGRLIRVGGRWLVRGEGAFHVRPECLLAREWHDRFRRPS